MKKEEIDELMKKVEILKDALGNSAGYLKPVWHELMLIGVAVFIAYLAQQLVIWSGKLYLDPIVWIGFALAMIAITFSIPYTYAKHSNKDEAKKGTMFFSMVNYITFFALFVAFLVMFLPAKVNPFIVNKQWYVWFIAYAFMLFTYGIFFSLKHFTISAFIVLLGIPISMLFPHYETIIGGTFLGLSLFIPSFIEYKRSSK
jgi:membrane-associated HD superfamily phosphohydrolase